MTEVQQCVRLTSNLALLRPVSAAGIEAEEACHATMAKLVHCHENNQQLELN